MKNLLMFHGGIRSSVKTLVDGEEHTLYYKAKTPAEVAAYLGAERRVEDTPEGDAMRQKNRAIFIAKSMCNESGELMFTTEEAELIPATLKPELCQMILAGSNVPGETGKRSPSRETSGSGSS